jgi:hypothetical protein
MGIFFVSAGPTEDFDLEHRLSGPSEKLDDAHWPARGDLAHIRLAGKVFVPHYAVPIPYVVERQSLLLGAPREDAPMRQALQPGLAFNVLDIAGRWAWGQVGEDGCVGYALVCDLARQADSAARA